MILWGKKIQKKKKKHSIYQPFWKTARECKHGNKYATFLIKLSLFPC